MTFRPGDRVTFRELEVPCKEICVRAGTRGTIQYVQDPCYWVRLWGGVLVRVTEEHVQGEERVANG
jgi:hypothetical protein